MKKLLGLASALAVLTAGAADGLAQSKEPVRLPFIQTFSGIAVDFGERMWREGVLPALKIINEQQGGINGRPLEFYKVDNKFPDTAAFLAEFRRLCADNNIPILYGIGATKTTISIFEDLKKCGMPGFNPSSAGSWPFPDFGGWLFRYQPNPDKTIPTMLMAVKDKLNLKTIALSHTLDDDFAVNNIKIARATLDKAGVKVVSEASFKTKETNFASQVANYRAANPDAMLLLHQPWDAGTFLLQLRDRGVQGQALADAIVAGEDFWKLSQGKAKGAIGYATYAADDPRPIVQNWLKLWRETTKRPNDAPDGFVTAYFEGTFILADVLRAAKDINDRKQIRDAFLKIKDRESVSGKISWPEVGDTVRSEAVLVQVSDNGVLKKWPN